METSLFQRTEPRPTFDDIMKRGQGYSANNYAFARDNYQEMLWLDQLPKRPVWPNKASVIGDQEYAAKNAFSKRRFYARQYGYPVEEF